MREEVNGLLNSQRFYHSLNFPTRLGYAYLTKNRVKGFAPLGKVPDWKCNAIQVIPGDIVLVLDVDVRHEADGHGFLPCSIPEDTPTVQTQSGNGRQYWFKGEPRLHTHADSSTRINVLTGSTGVFAPPSKIQGGGCYSWLRPVSPKTLRPLPEELFSFLSKMQEMKTSPLSSAFKAAIPGSKRLNSISPKQRARLSWALNGATRRRRVRVQKPITVLLSSGSPAGSITRHSGPCVVIRGNSENEDLATFGER